MGHITTPDRTCARDKVLHQGGITCWVAVIPAQPVAGRFDNSHGGTGFMVGSLDFYGFLPLATSTRLGSAAEPRNGRANWGTSVNFVTP